MKKIAVIGAGAMGLTCAYELAKKGYAVEVFEKDSVIGGMAAHFNFGGLSIEKYNHAVYGPDYEVFELMKELGIYQKLHWTKTRMGYYFDGKLYDWGPLQLLLFPRANPIEKLRYLFHVFYASKLKDWQKLDNLKAIEWIKDWEGNGAYRKFWDSLFDSKFHASKERISASWFWARCDRVAKSRKNPFQEQMGYIEGGTVTLLSELQKRIESCGGNIRLSSAVENIIIENDRVCGIVVQGKSLCFDAVISTIPLQAVNNFSSLPLEDRECISKLDNFSVVCVVLKLAQKLSPYYWLNTSDKRISAGAIIETDNLILDLFSTNTKTVLVGGGG